MRGLILKVKIFFCIVFESPLFIIEVKNGKAKKIKGNIKSGFTVDCVEIINRNNLEYGLIYAIKGQYGKYVLKVSNEIPKHLLQQLRNVWSFNS